MEKYILVLLGAVSVSHGLSMNIATGLKSSSSSSSSGSDEESSLVFQHSRKWTEMDSAIRDAEDEVLFGAQHQEDLRKAGNLTTLSGFNTGYDPSITTYHEAGDSAMDDDYLKSVFHRYYTTTPGEFPAGERFLTRDNAWKASKEIVMRWNNVGEDEAESYLNKNF